MKGFYLVDMKTEMERVTRPREKARENYNSLSRWYDLFTGSEKEFTDIGIQMLDVQPDEFILEIGCGTGHALTEFTKTNKNVCAIDLSEKMLKVARGKINHESAMLCQADGLLLPFSEKRFDTVFLSFVLELFDTPEIPKILSEIWRVLKHEGKLGVVSLVKEETFAISVYEWFHRRLPTLVDCRPIYLQPVIKGAGFHIHKSTVKPMWGLPVDIVVARKWSSSRVANQT